MGRISLATALVLLCASTASAQTLAARNVFVDFAIKADHDSTPYFYGSANGFAGSGATGVNLSDRSSLRFEVDVPSWRVNDMESSANVFCAPGACSSGTGSVPARTSLHDAARTVSYAFVYARHLPAAGRLQVAVVAGASVEARQQRSSGVFDELGPAGLVVAHHVYDTEGTTAATAAVLGLDAELRLTSRVSIAPEIRWHLGPYPRFAIVRPGVAVRWRF